MSPWQLVRNSLIAYKTHWKRYLLLTAIVAVPVNLIDLADSSGTGTTSFYTQLASLFMTTALLWAVVHERDLVGLAVRRSYYEGSGLLLRLTLTILTLAAVMIPAALGLTLYSLGTSAGSGATLGVELLLGGLGLILAIPSLVLLVRFGFAAFGVAGGDYPFTALRESRKLSLGRFWFVTKRVVLILLLAIVITLPALLVTFLVALVTHWSQSGIILQLYLNLYTIPVAVIAYHRLYRRLQGAEA